MCLEQWYYIAGIVTACTSVLGVIGLAFYAKETWKMRKAAEDQIEGTMKPCVLLLANPDANTSFSEKHLILKNVGSGVALNVRYQMAKNKGGPWIEGPALEVGGLIESHMFIKHLLNIDPLVCEFESLSGTRYKTESYISESTTDFDLRHRFKKLDQ